MKTCAATRLICALILAATAGLSDTARADPKLLAYGQHLAQECTTCHRRDGTDKGIPSIIGLEVDYFATTLKFYKTGARDNQSMVSVAKSLDDEQIKALAIYFGSLQPAAKKAQPASKRK